MCITPQCRFMTNIICISQDDGTNSVSITCCLCQQMLLHLLPNDKQHRFVCLTGFFGYYAMIPFSCKSCWTNCSNEMSTVPFANSDMWSPNEKKRWLWTSLLLWNSCWNSKIKRNCGHNPKLIVQSASSNSTSS